MIAKLLFLMTLVDLMLSMALADLPMGVGHSGHTFVGVNIA